MDFARVYTTRHWKDVPKKVAICYICGNGYETYEGMVTIPPDPCLIHNRHDILPTDTCSSPICKEIETRRQDALFSMVMASESEKRQIERSARTILAHNK